MTPANAARELLRRRAIRRDFGTWCETILAPLGQKPAAHHRLLIRELQAVADGHTQRLMLFLPPGAAKSTYASVLFPAWWLTQGNNRAIIAASHTAMLAEGFSRRVRSLVAENSTLLGAGVASEAVELWSTTRGGQYRAAGVGGAITGFRASLALADDLVKSRADADSETYRNRAWDWWQDDLTTRLKPGAPVVLIGTRWHTDDIYGRLLERQAGKWKVLSLPALAETNDALGRQPGEPLWADDGYGYAADLMVKKATSDTRTWLSLFQQRPTADTGDYFQKAWIRPVPTLPPRSSLRVFMGSDYAVTANGGDWTVHVVVGMDSDDRLYVLDVWRGQTASDQWIEAFCDLVIQWKPIGAAEESGQIRASIGPWLDRRQRERRAFVARTMFPTRGDKAVRAQSIRGRMGLSGLYIPADAPWRAEFEGELMGFPAAKFDDQVDALGLCGQLLDRMIPPASAKPPPEPADPWDRAFGRSRNRDTGDWKVA